MTFKHVKFEDSAVMRSLEKVAKEKGWAKEEPLKKTASHQTDLSATANLTENILKLCGGLRQRGFSKYADELEDKFVVYKQASTLYETSSEKGEDLVDAAHPKGSHKLEGVDGDEAVFETILDQHVKNLKMIDKMPTGKLASSLDILRAVKVALGQDVGEEGKKILEEINAQMAKVRAAANNIRSKSNPELTFSIDISIDGILEKSRNPTIDHLDDIKSSFTNLTRRLQPNTAWQYVSSYGFGGLSKDTWSIVASSIKAGQDATAQALTLRVKYNELVAASMGKEQDRAAQRPEDKPQSNPTLDKIKAARSSLNGIAGLVNADSAADPQDVADVKAWMKKVDESLKNLETSYSTMSPQDAEAALAKITKDFARVRQDWA